MIDCPVGAILAAAAGRLGEPLLADLAAGLAEPVRVGVRGRPGAGRDTVARVLGAAGVAVTGSNSAGAGLDSAGAGSDSAGAYLYVAVETLTPEDRAALAGARPCVAVLTKADLAGFGDRGPMAVSADRCAGLGRVAGVPVLPLAGLAAAAAVDPSVLDESVLDGIRALAAGGSPPGLRDRLLAGLDLFGLAVAVRAVRAGGGRTEVARALRAASGVDAVLAEIGRLAAGVRYRRAVGALRALIGTACSRPGVADLLAGDAMAEARMSLAARVLEAAGWPGDGDGSADPLQRAISWHRHARGPVTDLHRACAEDIVRGLLRAWSRQRGSW